MHSRLLPNQIHWQKPNLAHFHTVMKLYYGETSDKDYVPNAENSQKFTLDRHGI